MRARPIRLRGLRFPFAASLRVTWWGEPPHSCFPRHLELPACKGKKAKCDFAFFEYCLERQRSCLPPWGKVSAKPTEEGRSLLSGHPARRSARVRTLSFVTLSSSSLAYTVSILPMAKCSTCKAAPPLPKNLAPLRFSGALFIDRVEKSCAQAYQQTNAFPFHAFTLFKGEGGTSRFCGA